VTGAAFFDTNVVLYLLSDDTAKASRAEDLLAKGGTISVQVLNEFVAVARCKCLAPWPAIESALASLRFVCTVEPLTVRTHGRALALAKRFGIPIYDATIAASALEARCRILYSEDFQYEQVLTGMKIRNPFV
jgi:predicted nucleic acid-binding protein